MLVVSSAFGKSHAGRKIENAADFAAALLDAKKVAVVPGGPFGAEDCVRLSYSLSMEDMTEGLDRIDAFFNELS